MFFNNASDVTHYLIDFHIIEFTIYIILLSIISIFKNANKTSNVTLPLIWLPRPYDQADLRLKLRTYDFPLDTVCVHVYVRVVCT